MVRNAIHTENPEEFKGLTYGLWRNPIPHDAGIMFQLTPGIYGKKVTHIPLISEHDIGVHSKLIIWDPLAESDTHYHPSVHCFFTPVHNNGLSQSVLREDPHYGSATWITQPINTGRFMYIHDAIGPHKMMNTSRTRAIASYHLYISEHSLPKERV